MSAADEISQDFRLDESCVALTGDNRVRVYFAQVCRALAALQRSVAQADPITNAERQAVGAFLTRLQGTFETLALRHFYPEEGPGLKLDTHDSGFVHFSTLLELAADLERRDELLAALPPLEEQKRRMLAQIVGHSRHPRDLQVAMMRRLYLEALSEEKVFRSFLPGRLEKAGSQGDEASHFWSFATYDRALNRPFVYLVYFSWNGRKGESLAEDSKAFEEVRDVARHEARGRMSLLGFANRLDERVAALSPRIVKRLVLGPYWAPSFTQTEGPLGELLDSFSERLPYALRWESEVVIADRETRVGGGWLSKGQLRQVFWVPKELDLSARGVSQFDRTLLLPHWLAQHVRDAGLLADHHHVVIEE